MHFTLSNTVYTRAGKKVVWLEPGDYPILRYFDDKRVLVDVSTFNTAPRKQITILDMKQGFIVNDSKKNSAQANSNQAADLRGSTS